MRFVAGTQFVCLFCIVCFFYGRVAIYLVRKGVYKTHIIEEALWLSVAGPFATIGEEHNKQKMLVLIARV